LAIAPHLAGGLVQAIARWRRRRYTGWRDADRRVIARAIGLRATVSNIKRHPATPERRYELREPDEDRL